jgi:hypothetical protein
MPGSASRHASPVLVCFTAIEACACFTMSAPGKGTVLLSSVHAPYAAVKRSIQGPPVRMGVRQVAGTERSPRQSRVNSALAMGGACARLEEGTVSTPPRHGQPPCRTGQRGGRPQITPDQMLNAVPSCSVSTSMSSASLLPMPSSSRSCGVGARKGRRARRGPAEARGAPARPGGWREQSPGLRGRGAARARLQELGEAVRHRRVEEVQFVEVPQVLPRLVAVQQRGAAHRVLVHRAVQLNHGAAAGGGWGWGWGGAKGLLLPRLHTCPWPRTDTRCAQQAAALAVRSRRPPAASRCPVPFSGFASCRPSSPRRLPRLHVSHRPLDVQRLPRPRERHLVRARVGVGAGDLREGSRRVVGSRAALD